MSILIKGMEMPTSCEFCPCEHDADCLLNRDIICTYKPCKRPPDCPLVPVPPHGDLIDRDALAEDGWVLTKQVMRMGGYAIHELPLKNPTIPVIIPTEEGET